MKENNKLNKFISYFDNAKTVALLCHINPDSDTIGSALALRLALIKVGKSADVYCDDYPPTRLFFLPTIDVINTQDTKKYDVCIAVDCSSSDRFNVCGKYFKHAKTKLIIDHHKSSQNFADFSFCVPEAAATAELVYSVIKHMELTYGKNIIDHDIAVLLFSAIVGDTGAFSFDNTTKNTFTIASELLSYGVPSRDIIFDMIQSQTIERFKLKMRVLSKASFYENNKIGIITFTKNDFKLTNTNESFTEGIINDIINVKDVLIAYAITEISDKHYKISVRTKQPIDASGIAIVFGGGGHDRAAGFRLSGFYEDVIDKLIKSAKDVL